MNYLCEHYDLIFLQEHWLREEELNCLNSIHPEFTGFGVSAIDISSGFLSGRPYGGVCILWRKLITNYISIERYDDKRIIGCTFSANNDSKLFVNVYLPYQSDDNYDEYVHYLGKLTAIIDECNTSAVSIIGDFNAKVGSKFENELLNFVNSCNMYISDYEHFGRTSNTFTYVSDAHGSTSWLDHYICSHTMYNEICAINIVDKLPSSDHLPLSVIFRLKSVIKADIPVETTAPASNRKTSAQTLINYCT
jgi:exonuclease III